MFMCAIFIMYAISASTFLLGKNLLLVSSPLFLSGVRTFIGGVALLLYVWYTGKGSFGDSKKLLIPCVGVAVYSFFLSNTFKFWALQHTSSSHAAIISAIEPLFVIMIACRMFNELMTVRKWCGVILCVMSGMALTAGSYASLRVYDFVSWPSFFLCVAVISSAYGALLMRKLIRYENAAPALVMGMSMVIAGILALGATCTEASSCTVDASTLFPFAGNLLAMIFLSNIVAYSLYGVAIKRYSTLLISCGSFARPIFTAFYSSIFLHDMVSWHTIGCAGVLVVGLAILYCDESISKAVVVKS